MADKIGSFPFWVLWFDADGKRRDAPPIEKMIGSEIKDAGITDLFIFSHGWNNDQKYARGLYEKYFKHVDDLITAGQATLRPGAKIGVAGVFWPSMYWADESNPTGAPRDAAAAAGRGAGAMSDGDMARQLKAVYPAEHHQTIDDLAAMLDKKSNNRAELQRFQTLMQKLAPSPDALSGDSAAEDNAEANGLFNRDAETVFQDMDAAVPTQRVGGQAGLLGNLWNGAKNALRTTSYYEMKKRAGTVGKTGLGPLIGQIAGAHPQLRIHLIGHSFGARLVSFSLAGLPHNAGSASPVKSLLLIQGAFSHFAFADALPHDKNRGGGLKGMASRVDGPLVTTHSKHDKAVCDVYPAASWASRDDAQAANEKRPSKWGAMGSAGAQAVNAGTGAFGKIGTKYQLTSGKFLNVDGKDLIKVGDGVSGAHSDIFYPEIAWLSLATAGVTT